MEQQPPRTADAHARQTIPPVDASRRYAIHADRKRLTGVRGYVVTDQAGAEVVLALRPAARVRSITAVLAGAALFVLVGALCLPLLQQGRSPIATSAGSAAIIAGFGVGALLAFLLWPCWRIECFEPARREPAIHVRKRRGSWRGAWYAVSQEQRIIARLRRPWPESVFRQRWEVCEPSGGVRFMMREDLDFEPTTRQGVLSNLGLLPQALKLDVIGGDAAAHDHAPLGVLDRSGPGRTLLVLDLSGDIHRRIDDRLAIVAALVIDAVEQV